MQNNTQNEKALEAFLKFLDKQTYKSNNGVYVYRSDDEPVTHNELANIFLQSDMNPKEETTFNREVEYLNAGLLIEALQGLDPNAKVLIDIKQTNKAYGKQIGVLNSPQYESQQTWVNKTYGGATITVHLPDGAYIAKWPVK